MVFLKGVKKRGFSLVELSIAIMVISILMAGVFSMSSGSVVNSKSLATQKKLDVVYKALGEYLAINKRLPCPASLLESKNESTIFGGEVRNVSGCIGPGVYKSSTIADLYYGGVPTKILNLSADYAFDEYGNRFSYYIQQRFTFNYIPLPIVNINASSFGTSYSAGGVNLLTVSMRDATGNLQTLKSDAILVILSHGANSSGSFNGAGVQNAVSSEVDEGNNQANAFNDSVSPPTATYDNVFIYSSLTSDIFDDIVIYKTRSDFVNDFKLEGLIACDGATIGDASFSSKNLYYGQYLYANSACATNNSIIKIIKCGAGGVWQPIVSACP